MNKLKAILKVDLINNYKLNGFSGNLSSTKEKNKMLFASLAMLVGVAAIGYMVAGYAVLMADALEPVGFLELILIMGILVSTMSVFFTSIYKAQGSLFTSRDYDLLMSLPIKNSTILTSKLINLLSLNWIITVFTLVPMSFVYFTRVGNLSYLYFFVVAVGVVVLPLIPTVLAAVLAIIISYFASKFKYKNITTILGTIIMLIGFMAASFYVQNIVEALAAKSSSIIDVVGKIYIPAIYLTHALTDINLIDLFKFVLISSLLFIAFILVFSKSFKQINSRLGETYKKSDYKIKSLRTNSLLLALTKKEIKTYISTPIYVLNTFIGMLMILAAAISTLFIDGKTLATYLDLPYMKELFPLIILAMMVFSIGMSTTTSSSISLEGKNLWIIKSLPIREKDIFLSKIILNLIVTLPITLLVNIIFFIGLRFSIYSFLWNLIISALYCFMSAGFGLLINLYLPKLDWTSPTDVVKRSASVFISVIVTVLPAGLLMGVFKFLEVDKINTILGITSGLLVLIIGILWGGLNSRGARKFKEL